MGYRNEIYRASCAAASSPNTPSAIPVGSYCIPAPLNEWQSRGWVAFGGLDHAEKSATRPNAKDSSIIGLSYSLQHCQEDNAEKILLRIDSWCYDKYGETTDLPIMEILFDAKDFLVPARAVESLKIMARPVRFNEKIASRTVNAALFLINQINADQVPDFERVLELHRIHPELNRDSGTKNGKPRGSVVRARTVSLKPSSPAKGKDDGRSA